MVTTGASNDIERATAIARNMVTKWGMSDNLGPLLYEEEDNGSIMGASRNANVSGEVSKQIDVEIRNLIDRNYRRAQKILLERASELELMTVALMTYETIDADQIKNIMQGRPSGEPKDWHDSNEDDTSDKTPGEAASEDEIAENTSEESRSDDLSGDGPAVEDGAPKAD